MPTTPSTKSFSSSHHAPSARLNEGTAAKEVRAREHARHRTKERREHALAKERKEKATAARVSGLKVTHTHGAKLVRKLSMESWDGEEPGEKERSAPGAVSGAPAQGPESGTDADVAPSRERSNVFAELTLGDFVSEPRRPKGKRGCLNGVVVVLVADVSDVAAELDFELVPPIRAVIALDDPEGDEAWEYITRASLNDGSAWKGKSYAQAVASAM